MDHTIIESVHIKYVYPYLSCHIKTYRINNTCQYAFYIYKNSEKIHTIWYQTCSDMLFYVGNDTGQFRIRAFAKINDETDNMLSQSIFTNPITINFKNNSLGCDVVYNLQKNWSYPSLFFSSDNPYLFVLCPSAINRKKQTPPVFSRFSWAKEGIFPGNVISIADPILSLYEDMNVGWCIGDKYDYAIKDLSEIIIEIAKERKIPYKNIIFYGSSAGGFTALSLAAHLEGSTAVAINSQTDILKFESTRAVENLRQKVFFGLSIDKIYENYADRVDMITRYKKVYKSKVFLVQNIQDKHHYEVHFKPFLNSLGGTPSMGISTFGRHISWVYNQEGGHIPEDKEMAKHIIKSVISGITK